MPFINSRRFTFLIHGMLCEKMKRGSLELLNYIYNLKPVVNFGAMFSDGSENYRIPAEPMPGDNVTLRFRTASDNVDEVFCVVNDQKHPMTRVRRERIFDYYEVTLENVTESFKYYFEIHAGNLCCYYNKLFLQKSPDPEYSFEVVPGFKVPDWAKGAVFYQIFVDRFCNGDLSNDVKENEYSYIGKPVHAVTDWNKKPDAMDVGNFYGGDLLGVINKLDYLKDLGVDVIYLNPIFVSPSNHKYDIQDYDYVDPHFGRIVYDEGDVLPPGELENKKSERYINRVTDIRNLEASNELFISLVEEVHKRGMKIILDGVFNHSGSFNKWMDRERIYEGNEEYPPGAFISENSPYRSFYKFQDAEAWPYNKSYDGWWGHDTLPKLNYEESQKLHDYIMHIGRKWVSPPYNADGWRLDVAADLGYSEEYNHRFWRDFREAVREANPNAIILAEHYGSAREWLRGDQWDTIMNYGAFMEPITWFLCGVEKHSDEFRGDFMGNPDFFFNCMKYYMASMNQNSIEVAMNELSNHDHSRFLTRTNKRVGRLHTLGADAASEDISYGLMRMAVAFQMTWPGAPTIYYGDEAGVCGWTDPDSRRTYPWGHENKELIQFHKDMIAIHKGYEVFKKGSLVFIHGESKCIVYGRFTEEEAAVIILNSDYSDKMLKVHVRHLGVRNNRSMKRVILCDEDGYTMDDQICIVQNNLMNVVIPAMSAAVYVGKLK